MYVCICVYMYIYIYIYIYILYICMYIHHLTSIRNCISRSMIAH